MIGNNYEARMDSAIHTTTNHRTELKSQIKATDLCSIFDNLDPKIKYLSLDCFDTLIWRKTATPSDIFFEMQNRPAFQAIGMTARLRSQGEEIARQKMFIKHGITEVTLRDIYLAHYPSLNEEQLQALSKDEVAAEIETCYAFPPVVNLIRKAHASGKKIIIVSDTYFRENELQQILQACLPQDVMSMIMKIFCSCEYGWSKSGGVFKKVMENLYEDARSFIHIGDNFSADYAAPQALGINAVHLIHNDKKIGELVRMQALAGGFIDPSIRQTRALVNPFRGAFAAAQVSTNKPESMIGYMSVGPIMYSFAHFIRHEIEALQKQNKQLKVLFLMRDGYLPSLACEALTGKELGKRVCISRFASFAASFRSKEDVDRYLAETVHSLRFYDMCKQFLLSPHTASEISEAAARAANPVMHFVELIHQKHILESIFNASKTYRNRLKKHLVNEVGIEHGDTLMFVDLGYTGTSQLKLEPVFREEMGIEITGRYLIALGVPEWEKSRRGLLDPSWCDDRTMNTLVAYIALLEQICTSNDKSVIDYDDHGNPIYSETSVNKSQHGKLNMIQAECIRFIHETDNFFKHANTQLSLNILRDTALGELTRMLFLPTASELEYLQSFEFDLNLGTKELLNVFDKDKGLTGLRRRGLYFMEKNIKSMRTNYPAELRSAGLELALTLMAQHRIGFDLRADDLTLRRETLNVIAIHGGNATQTSIQAIPTHDGYFSLIVPVGYGDFQIGVQFGLNYKWVQIESAELIVTSALYSSRESNHTEDASANIIVDQMNDKGGGLFECLSDTSLLVYVPQGRRGNHHYALRIIFRPIDSKNKKG